MADEIDFDSPEYKEAVKSVQKQIEDSVMQMVTKGFVSGPATASPKIPTTDNLTIEKLTFDVAMLEGPTLPINWEAMDGDRTQRVPRM